jgi:hypothetical protein
MYLRTPPYLGVSFSVVGGAAGEAGFAGAEGAVGAGVAGATGAAGVVGAVGAAGWDGVTGADGAVVGVPQLMTNEAHAPRINRKTNSFFILLLSFLRIYKTGVKPLQIAIYVHRDNCENE